MEWNKLTYAGQSELVRVIRARVDVSPSEDVTFNIRLQYDNASDLLGLSGRRCVGARPRFLCGGR